MKLIAMLVLAALSSVACSKEDTTYPTEEERKEREARGQPDDTTFPTSWEREQFLPCWQYIRQRTDCEREDVICMQVVEAQYLALQSAEARRAFLIELGCPSPVVHNKPWDKALLRRHHERLEKQQREKQQGGARP